MERGERRETAREKEGQGESQSKVAECDRREAWRKGRQWMKGKDEEGS